MKKEGQSFDIVLFLITLFLGWFGIDKLYKAKNWRVFVIKLLANFIFIGEIWNIFDLIMICIGRYEVDPRAYLD